MSQEILDPQQQAIRQARENDPYSRARRLAVQAYRQLIQHARSRHNRGNIAEAALGNRILKNEPLSFLSLYGLGSKTNLDKYDFDLLHELHQLSQSAADAVSYIPGSQVYLLIADVHGHFNGFVDPNSGLLRRESYEYLAAVAVQAQKLGLVPLWLSELYQKRHLALPNVHQPIDESSEVYELFWIPSRPGDHRLDQLVESATRHNHWGVDPMQAAFHYAAMRLNERPLLEAEFADTILLVHGSKNLAGELLPPNMPALFLSTRPSWFQVAHQE